MQTYIKRALMLSVATNIVLTHYILMLRYERRIAIALLDGIM
jgi:hypothetical protein